MPIKHARATRSDTLPALGAQSWQFVLQSELQVPIWVHSVSLLGFFRALGATLETTLEFFFIQMCEVLHKVELDICELPVCF